MYGVFEYVAVSAVVLACAAGVQAEVAIETVTVGNPGNAADTRYETPGYGDVAYVYRIGKFEITAGQYTEFLNTVAATDTYGLYNEDMGDPSTAGVWGCNIQREGSPGSYSYSIEPDWADRPVNVVSWGDAARFCNWLHNGQPTGAQDLTTTEDGSYYLNGATTDGELIAIVREDGATWVIPSKDEWYKAAYHKNDGVMGNYWDYPASSDSFPSNDLIDPDPGNNATYYCYDDLDFTIGSPYYRTVAGEHEKSDSPYGTFDQGGNVEEWSEEVHGGGLRGLLGGYFDGPYGDMRARNLDHGTTPSTEGFWSGIRVTRLLNDTPIPTLSEWGVAAMALLVLSAGTVVLMRGRVGVV